MTCIGTWSELEATVASEAEKAVADPEIGLLHEDDTATASTNQSAIAQEAKYPRILALRDQKGSGECLEYRKIENSLQVSLLPRCRRKEVQKQNFGLKGSCQEALRDKHALASGLKISSYSFIILITMTVTVMWKL